LRFHDSQLRFHERGLRFHDSRLRFHDGQLRFHAIFYFVDFQRVLKSRVEFCVWLHLIDKTCQGNSVGAAKNKKT
jgi:hypothetical protein